MSKPTVYILNKKWTAAIAFALVIWLTGIILTPYWAGSSSSLLRKLAVFGYFFYQPVCHQLPFRSLWLDSFTLAVCIRCFGLYLGALLTVTFYLFRTRIPLYPYTLYLLFVLPAVIDFIFPKLSVYQDIPLLRFVSGLLLGAALFQILLVSTGRVAKRVPPDRDIKLAQD